MVGDDVRDDVLGAQQVSFKKKCPKIKFESYNKSQQVSQKESSKIKLSNLLDNIHIVIIFIITYL